MTTEAPTFVGTVKEMCEYLHLSRRTLYRRFADTPECFRRLGKIVLFYQPK